MLEYTKHQRLLTNSTSGYQYFIDCAHPLASTNGVVYYHRHVASLAKGCWLTSREHVHHLDGNPANNTPENLVVLSGRAHARLHNPILSRSTKICAACGEKFMTRRDGAVLCSNKCSGMIRRKFDVDKPTLELLVWKMPTTHIAREYGVSDKAVEKRCILLGVKKPPRGYWAKLRAKAS